MDTDRNLILQPIGIPTLGFIQNHQPEPNRKPTASNAWDPTGFQKNRWDPIRFQYYDSQPLTDIRFFSEPIGAKTIRHKPTKTNKNQSHIINLSICLHQSSQTWKNPVWSRTIFDKSHHQKANSPPTLDLTHHTYNSSNPQFKKICWTTVLVIPLWKLLQICSNWIANPII
jgi:hypothetical protein